MLIQVFGQNSENSVYKNLKTKNFYSVSLSSQTINNKGIFEVNGKKVDKETYNKYLSTWKNMEKCCPCILKSYNENDILLRESVSCTDCGVGWFKEFYPNGNVKLIGFYKENPTGKWKNIWNRGYCSVKNNQWTYFKENGDTLYSEYWNNGKFVKQYPEQDSVEVWKTELYLHGKKYEFQKINFDDFGNFMIVPKFKNKLTSTNFRVDIKVPTNYNVKFKSSTTSNPFGEINPIKIFEDANVPNEKRTGLEILVYLDDKYLDSFIIPFKR